MTQQATIKQDINRLIEFRQAVYPHGLPSGRNAWLDLGLMSGRPSVVRLQTVQELAPEQIKALAEARKACLKAIA